jgi:predicted PurR-regulated permease PerM
MPAQPFYVKGAVILLLILSAIAILHYGQPLWVPLLTALMFTALTLPVVRRLESWGASRFLAALTGVLGVFAVFALVGGVLLWQLRAFWTEFDLYAGVFQDKYRVLEMYVATTADLPISRSEEWLHAQRLRLLEWSADIMLGLFGSAEMAVSRLILIPVFMFFILIYRERLPVFVANLQPRRRAVAGEVIEKVSGLAQHYVRGLLTVTGVVWFLASLGFAAVGLRFAVLAGLLLALLNVIPFVGFLLGAVFPVLVALLQMQSPAVALASFGVVVLVHLLDANFLTPRIMGPTVIVNPLVSILALIGGAMLWGLPGIILAVLAAGIVKMVFDKVEALQPYGFLMGEELEYPHGGPGPRLLLPEE